MSNSASQSQAQYNQTTNQNQGEGQTKCSLKSIPCIFWYILPSFVAHIIFILITCIIDNLGWYWGLFVIMVAFIGGLAYFICYAAFKHADVSCGCRTTIAVLLLVGSVIYIIVIYVMSVFGAESPLFWLLLIFTINLICAISAHWCLINQSISQVHDQVGNARDVNSSQNGSQNQDNVTKA